jgi:hypothetical protein
MGTIVVSLWNPIPFFILVVVLICLAFCVWMGVAIFCCRRPGQPMPV